MTYLSQRVAEAGEIMGIHLLDHIIIGDNKGILVLKKKNICKRKESIIMANIYGVDIGTSNFKMCCKDKEDILNEKNIIAIANKKDLLAFGDEAYEMYEKAPENIEVSFPVKFGVIADIEKYADTSFKLFNKINGDKKAPGNTDFYIAVPTDVTEVEKELSMNLLLIQKLKQKIYILLTNL